ncbi:hypothetical protein NQD34_014530 [Periophthalmus magnuspinnatus]|nr:hypothetical protein NQD34_014530 [Periophthalmus magnuspinnatus]
MPLNDGGRTLADGECPLTTPSNATLAGVNATLNDASNHVNATLEDAGHHSNATLVSPLEDSGNHVNTTLNDANEPSNHTSSEKGSRRRRRAMPLERTLR